VNGREHAATVGLPSNCACLGTLRKDVVRAIPSAPDSHLFRARASPQGYYHPLPSLSRRSVSTPPLCDIYLVTCDHLFATAFLRQLFVLQHNCQAVTPVETAQRDNEESIR
jgi:hypothetical protein